VVCSSLKAHEAVAMLAALRQMSDGDAARVLVDEAKLVSVDERRSRLQGLPWQSSQRRILMN